MSDAKENNRIDINSYFNQAGAESRHVHYHGRDFYWDGRKYDDFSSLSNTAKKSGIEYILVHEMSNVGKAIALATVYYCCQQLSHVMGTMICGGCSSNMTLDILG